MIGVTDTSRVDEDDFQAVGPDVALNAARLLAEIARQFGIRPSITTSSKAPRYGCSRDPVSSESATRVVWMIEMRHGGAASPFSGAHGAGETLLYWKLEPTCRKTSPLFGISHNAPSPACRSDTPPSRTWRRSIEDSAKRQPQGPYLFAECAGGVIAYEMRADRAGRGMGGAGGLARCLPHPRPQRGEGALPHARAFAGKTARKHAATRQPRTGARSRHGSSSWRSRIKLTNAPVGTVANAPPVVSALVAALSHGSCAQRCLGHGSFRGLSVSQIYESAKLVTCRGPMSVRVVGAGSEHGSAKEDDTPIETFMPTRVFSVGASGAPSHNRGCRRRSTREW